MQECIVHAEDDSHDWVLMRTHNKSISFSDPGAVLSPHDQPAAVTQLVDDHQVISDQSYVLVLVLKACLGALLSKRVLVHVVSRGLIDMRCCDGAQLMRYDPQCSVTYDWGQG